MCWAATTEQTTEQTTVQTEQTTDAASPLTSAIADQSGNQSAPQTNQSSPQTTPDSPSIQHPKGKLCAYARRKTLIRENILQHFKQQVEIGLWPKRPGNQF